MYGSDMRVRDLNTMRGGVDVSGILILNVYEWFDAFKKSFRMFTVLFWYLDNIHAVTASSGIWPSMLCRS